MVHRLEIPKQLSTGSSHSNNRTAEKIITWAIRPDAIIVRRSKRHVENAALLIYGHIAPDIDPGTLLPALAAPALIAGLSRTRDRVERPNQLARMDVPRPRIPGGAHSAALA